MAVTDPSWFYSALSQVTAAVEAILGGFLVLRLQDYEKSWQDVRVRLEVGQARWSHEYLRDQDSGLSWYELRRVIEEREQAAMPRHIFWSALCLAFLLAIGSIGPLAALDEPASFIKAWFLAPWAVLAIVFAVITYKRTDQILGQLKEYELWDLVEGYYETQLAEAEGWKARRQEEEEERRRSKDSGPDSATPVKG